MATKINEHQKIIEKVRSSYPQDIMKTDRKSEVLHALILKGKPLATIAKWIDKIEQTGNQKFYTHRGIYSLTPLDCCALMDNDEAAQLLLKKEGYSL